MKDKYYRGMVLSYISMGICIIMGFNKMFIYENSDLSFIPSKNAYVGGDAYNYIINASYSTAWFVLAGVCAIIGLTFVVANYLNKKVELNENDDEIIKEDKSNGEVESNKDDKVSFESGESIE